MNLPIRKLLKKIPIDNIKQVISELDSSKINILLYKIAGTDVDHRECLWIEAIIKIPGIKIPSNLQLSL